MKRLNARLLDSDIATWTGADCGFPDSQLEFWSVRSEANASGARSVAIRQVGARETVES